MSSTEISHVQTGHDLLERVVVQGDLSRLSSAERLTYYKAVCESVGLNPLTKPLDYLTLNGKLVLYANRSCTDQLRTLRGVSITKLEHDMRGEAYVVTAYAKDEKERTDASTGVVWVGRLQGDALANALMKAETKAKRRVTLSLCGLGLLDETEVETIPGAMRATERVTEVVGRGDTFGASGGAIHQAERRPTGVGEPQHAPGDPSAPVGDPETYRQESERVLPFESEERTQLMKTIQTMTPSHIKVLSHRLLGDQNADLTKVDLASLKLLADQAKAR